MSNGQGPGWLVDQLPQPLAEDEFTRRFVSIFEEIAGSYRERAETLAYELDPGMASPEFVRWTAGWLGLHVDGGLEESRQRALVRAAGTFFPWRGTAFGLEGMLEAMTGNDVTVEDDGGVFTKGKTPSNTHAVTITLADASGLNEQHLLELVRHEVPADAVPVLRVGKRTVAEAAAEKPADASAAGKRAKAAAPASEATEAAPPEAESTPTVDGDAGGSSGEDGKA